MTNKVISRAPLRISFAGGGTDIPSYYKIYSGNILNVTINKFIFVILKKNQKNTVIFKQEKKSYLFKNLDQIKNFKSNNLFLQISTYLYMISKFNENKFLPVEIEIKSDSKPGTGLGSSSTFVVSLVNALAVYLGVNLSKSRTAKIAHHIERDICGLSGGLQDQYAASFGGFNNIKIDRAGNVQIKKIRPSKNFIALMESSLYILNLGISRDSSKIIDDQNKKIKNNNYNVLKNFKFIKQQTDRLIKSIKDENFQKMTGLIDQGWIFKKNTSSKISNKKINDTINFLIRNNAKGIKVSGAGGGGYLFFFLDISFKNNLLKIQKKFPGIEKISFVKEGVLTF